MHVCRSCCGPCTPTLCVQFNSSTAVGTPPIQGVPVTFKTSGGAVVGSCVTNSLGQCCVGLTAADTYTIVFPGGTATQVVTCGGTFTKNIGLATSGAGAKWGSCTFGVSLCNGGCAPNATVPATVTITGGLSRTLTFTSSANQTVFCPLASTQSTTAVFSAASHTSITCTNSSGSIVCGGVGGFFNWIVALQPILVFPTGLCNPTYPCFEATPATIHCTCDNAQAGGKPIWGTLAGTTFAMSLSGNYIWTASVPPVAGQPNTGTITLSFQGSCPTLDPRTSIGFFFFQLFSPNGTTYNETCAVGPQKMNFGTLCTITGSGQLVVFGGCGAGGIYSNFSFTE